MGVASSNGREPADVADNPSQARVVHVTSPDLITVGDLMIDVTVGSSALLRGGHEHGRIGLHFGGSAANAAVWAAAAGIRAAVMGRVGDDVAGRMLRTALAGRGVEARVAVDPLRATGAMLVVREAGARSIVADRGANAGLSPDDLPPVLDAGAVLISGYTLLDPDAGPAAAAAFERTRATYLAVDAASSALIERYGRDRFLRDTAGATMLLANEREAECLTGLRGADAARALSGQYAAVAVKCGAAGAIYASRGDVLQQPAPAVVEADGTGAGDAFDGAFLAGLVQRLPVQDALARACEAGARCAASETRWP